MVKKPLTPALAEMDVRIARLQEEFTALKRAADRLAVIANDLHTLQRARAIMAGEDPDAPGEAPTPRTGFGLRATVPHVNGRNPREGSTTTLTLEILKEAGAPLPLKQIVDGLRARGSQVTVPGIIGILSRAVKKGMLRRPAPSTYALEVRRT